MNPLNALQDAARLKAVFDEIKKDPATFFKETVHSCANRPVAGKKLSGNFGSQRPYRGWRKDGHSTHISKRRMAKQASSGRKSSFELRNEYLMDYLKCKANALAHREGALKELLLAMKNGGKG